MYKWFTRTCKDTDCTDIDSMWLKWPGWDNLRYHRQYISLLPNDHIKFTNAYCILLNIQRSKDMANESMGWSSTPSNLICLPLPLPQYFWQSQPKLVIECFMPPKIFEPQLAHPEKIIHKFIHSTYCNTGCQWITMFLLISQF